MYLSDYIQSIIFSHWICSGMEKKTFENSPFLASMSVGYDFKNQMCMHVSIDMGFITRKAQVGRRCLKIMKRQRNPALLKPTLDVPVVYCSLGMFLDALFRFVLPERPSPRIMSKRRKRGDVTSIFKNIRLASVTCRKRRHAVRRLFSPPWKSLSGN